MRAFVVSAYVSVLTLLPVSNGWAQYRGKFVVRFDIDKVANLALPIGVALGSRLGLGFSA